ncbi:MAG: hypothetical protein LIO93_08585 [Bacteroidales bacterium]|nr:hypothetical protein [Bacteroidales bacterium]
MKKLFRNLFYVFTAVVLSAGLYSCEDEAGEVEDNDNVYKEILDKYVNTTIIPTYKALAESALEMRKANKALQNNPSDATMKTASDAWMDARIKWELNEAFLFGPVGEDGLDVDGHTDSWPLELEAIKKSIQDEGGEITGREAWLLESEVIGFHVAEYLLYRDGASRPVADLSTAELKYLTAVTDALVWDCMLAYVAWVGIENVSPEIKEVFEENPDVVKYLNDNTNWKDFANKMKNGTGYSSLAAAVTEISTGIVTIAEEVGATKINAPYESRKVEDVESWYSWHSLDDYTNNIYSIKNAYLGGINDNTRTSVSLHTYIAQKNSQLDQRIIDKIEDCITKIQAIGKDGKSFYEVVRDQTNKAEVDAAVDACLELANMFSSVEEIINQ